MSDNLSIVNRLREWIKSHYERQDEFAEAVGVTPQQVSNWLSGQRNPTSKETLDKFRALGMDTNWLLYGEESEDKIDRKLRELQLRYEKKLLDLSAENRMLRERLASIVDLAANQNKKKQG